MEISSKLIQGNGLCFALLSNDSCLNRLKELDSNFKNFIKNISDPYTRVSEMAQKVFEGDVVFSILNDREKIDQSKSRTQHLLRRLFGPSQGPPCTRLYFFPRAKRGARIQ